MVAYALIACLPTAVCAQTKTLVAVMSESTSNEFAAAATLFLKENQTYRLVLRSTAQVERASDEELQVMLQGAEALLLSAVFGDEATRFEKLLRHDSPPTMIA